jgi:hypothetical protein
MERDQVISILEALAEGQPPFVTEALTIATAAMRKARPASAGARWTEEEDVRLCTEFDGGMAVREIARKHGRTPGAITSRLVRLGRLEAGAVVSRDRGARAVEG